MPGADSFPVPAELFFKLYRQENISGLQAAITALVGQGWEVVEKYISSQNCAAGQEDLEAKNDSKPMYPSSTGLWLIAVTFITLNLVIAVTAYNF